jgi:hypothetical protein
MGRQITVILRDADKRETEHRVELTPELSSATLIERNGRCYAYCTMVPTKENGLYGGIVYVEAPQPYKVPW